MALRRVASSNRLISGVLLTKQRTSDIVLSCSQQPSKSFLDIQVLQHPNRHWMWVMSQTGHSTWKMCTAGDLVFTLNMKVTTFCLPQVVVDIKEAAQINTRNSICGSVDLKITSRRGAETTNHMLGSGRWRPEERYADCILFFKLPLLCGLPVMPLPQGISQDGDIVMCMNQLSRCHTLPWSNIRT